MTHTRRLFAIVGLLMLVATLALACDGGDEARTQNHLAYLDADGALWLVNADGSDRQKLADDGTCGPFSRIDWTPTGERLVCQSDDRLVIREADGAIVNDAQIEGLWFVAWSPSGDAFLYWTVTSRELGREATYQLFIADDAGRTTDDLGSVDSAVVGSGWADDGYPLWSPDGSRLAYRSAETGTVRIYSMNDGTQRTLEGNDYPMGWVLNGDALLVAANYVQPREDQAAPSYEAHLLQLSTGERTRVPGLDDNRQFWISRDGSHLAVVVQSQGSPLPALSIQDLRTGEVALVPDSVISYGSDAIPHRAVTFSSDGSYVYWSDFQNGSTLYRARLDGTDHEQLLQPDVPGIAWSSDTTLIAYSDFDFASETVRLRIAAVDGNATHDIDEKPFGGATASSFPIAWQPPP